MYKGLSVSFQTKYEFEKLKKFLGNYLYFSWNQAYIEKLTAVVIYYDDEEILSIGSIGCAEKQENLGCRIVKFNDYFYVL